MEDANGAEATKLVGDNNRHSKPKKIPVDRIDSPADVYEKYVCPHCKHLLDEAVQSACGHRLCRCCAEELFSRDDNPFCLVKEDGDHRMIPDDVEEGSQKFFPDKFAQRDIAKIKVTCEFPKCPAIMTVKDLKNHLSECEFAGEVCKFCEEFVPNNKLEGHSSVCPKMEKSCPLSELEWPDDLSRQLNETQNEHLQAKWNETLASCKGHKLKADEYQTHVNQSHEKHWKSIAGVVNILLMVCSQLFKNNQSSERPSASGDVERDGHLKPLLKLASTFGADVAPDGQADFTRELEKQIVILRNIVDDIRKDSLQSHKQLVATQNDLALALDQIKDLKAKVDFFEQKLSTREQQLEEKDFRISLLEAANYDGTMIWRISGFESRTKDARDARYTSIFSLPFYTSKYGYKMCLRLYPLGDGMGKNTHLSLFFVVMKSEYDSLLQWPFTNKVTLTLINQSGGPDVTDTFKPDPKSSSFQRPKTEMNVASGCPRFVPLDDLHRNGFIKDDTIFIKVKVESISTRY